MAESPVQATDTAAPQDKGVLGRAVGVLFSPRQTFALVAARPRWFGMLVLVAVVTALVTGGFMLTSVGQQAYLDMMERQSGAQAAEAMQRFVPIMGYATMVAMVIFTPIVLLVISGILFAIFTVGTGGNATFKQLFAVVVCSQAVALLGAIVKVPLNFATRSMTASTSLAVFFPMLDDTSFFARLFGMIDLFMVWWIVVLAIGCGVLYKRRTGPIAVGFFVLFALIAVVIAAIQAAGARS